MSGYEMFFYIITSALSLSYIVYGKKQHNSITLICGLGLGVIPYFDLQMWQMSLVALGLIVLPYLISI